MKIKNQLVMILMLISFVLRAANVDVKIVDIKPTPFFPKVEKGESIKQIAQIKVSNQQNIKAIQVRVSIQGKQSYLGGIDTLEVGNNIVDVQVLDMKNPTSVKFELLDENMKVLTEKEMTWQPQKKWKVYYNAVSHQDLGFITYYQNIRKACREAGIDMALEYCKETDSWADDDKFRWNVESSEPILRWMSKQSPEKVDEFKRRIKEGRIEITANHNTISSQMAGYEVLARSFYNSNRYVVDKLEIDPAKVSILNDVTGITRSWPLYSKEAQVPYLMHGSNEPNCLKDMYDLPVFYWNSSDGDTENKILCRADSYYSPNKIKKWDKDGVNYLIQRHVDLEWDYDCILAYDSHDFAIPTMENAKNIRAWNEKYAYPRIRCATISSFFDDVTKQIIPGKVYETSKDAPDSWDDQDATDAELLAKARRVNFEIPATEKFASIAMAVNGGYPEKDIFQAYNRTVMYHEHTNGAIDGGNHKYYETERVMHETLIDEAIDFNKRALKKSLDKISSQIRSSGDAIVIYNSLNWKRDEMVYFEADEIPFPNFSIIDPYTKNAVELQKLKNGKFTFFAEDIPSLGYKTYQIKKSEIVVVKTSQPTEINILENDFYKLKIDTDKNIISELFDKDLGKQILDKNSPYTLGEYIHYDHFTKEWKPTKFTDVKVYRGELLDEIHISQDAYSTSKVKLIVYLQHKIKKIDFILDVDKLSNGERLKGGWNRSVHEAMFCAVPVDIPNYQHHHELAGAVTQPGKKELQFEASESAYYAIQHFADASNEDYGVTLSTIESALVEYGKPRPGYWNSGGRKPKEEIEKPENSSMFLYLMNNFFCTNIRVDQPGNKQFTFAINSHKGNWKKGHSYKFAWETSHPIMTQYISKNDKGILNSEKSFLTVDKDNVVCSTLKKAESNGAGYVLRFFELEGKKSKVKIKLELDNRIKKAYATSLIENNLQELNVNENNEIEFEINGHGIKTIRVESKPLQKVGVKNLIAEPISDSEIKLTWVSDKVKDVSHFKVYRSLRAECIPNARNFIGTSESANYLDKTELQYGGWPSNRLDENTKYYYRIAAVDHSNNEGNISEAIESKTFSKMFADAKPEKVKGVYAVHVSPLSPENYINLWFYTNFEKDVDEYRIHRGETKNFIPDESNLINVHIPSEHTIDFNGTYNASELNRQMYADETAENNKVYYYKVCAVDAKGQKGEYSNPAECKMTVVPVSITQLKRETTDFSTFDGEARIKIETSIPNCEIYYSFDNPAPTRKSLKYSSPIKVNRNVLIHVAVYKIGETKPICQYSQFEKVNQALFQSSYGSSYTGDMAVDGVNNTGSQWVSKQYGGGSKIEPKDVWLGVNLPDELVLNGVAIAGDKREMMPIQDGFKVLLRQKGKLVEVENATVNPDSSIKNYYKVDFGGEKLCDGIMIYFDSDKLPKSENLGQDGIVRICEFMFISSDGKEMSLIELER